jgi:hypothetical protein
MFKIIKTDKGFELKKPKKNPNIEGELEIEKFLAKMGIKYSKRKKISDLKKDSKKYRMPDFYLPEHDLSIEYFGSWDETKKDYFGKKEIKRFLKKVLVYQLNELNCLFIYPKDLATAPTLIMKAINKNAKINPYQDIKIPWLNYEKIEKPLPSDFITKPLNWQLDWLNPKKIEEPLPSDFIREKKKEINITVTPLEEPEFEEPTQNGGGDFVISLVGVLLILAIIALIIIFILVYLSFGL